MVRSATKESSEESPKKKSSSKKKSNATGVWPCKINGCNKQFAREADLKRHQRTTKLHSMPGFACPQCEATFTRTDALRRHQKSRHNGVIVEPIDPSQKDGDDKKSLSRSRSPGAKGEGKSTPSSPFTNSSGPSSGYYRQHTAAYVPPRIEGQYDPPIGHPTSSTRNWPPPPPWATDTISQAVGQIPYPHPMPVPPLVYFSGPYFHTDHVVLQPSLGSQDASSSSTKVETDCSGSHLQKSSADLPSHKAGTANTHLPQFEKHATTPVIDPSLQLHPTTSDPQTNQKVTNLTSNAKEGNNRQIKGSTMNDEGDTDDEAREESPLHHHSTSSDAEGETDMELEQEQPKPSGRPEPMEQLLTEDGEPMLNPAELLTQESLASPPP